MPSANHAALIPSQGEPLQVKEVETNHPRSGEVLIRTHAIAVQPLDAKMVVAGYGGAGNLQYPAVFGAGGAGVIEELGEDVTGFGVGDRVVFDSKAYAVPGENRRQGTWQQLVIVGSQTVAKIGDTAFEQAVSIDWPLQTAVAALHLYLGMGTPGSGSKEEKVLIWGAGGAVGSYAVQYAKSVGHTVVVTASPRDTERQKRNGASEVIDYRAADAVDRLRELGPYKYMLTASGDLASQKALASLLQPQGGKFASTLGGEADFPSNVERVYQPFSLAAQREENGEFRAWYFREFLPKVLQEGLVEPAKFTKVSGGLAALQQACTDVYEGKVRGKLIINPQE